MKKLILLFTLLVSTVMYSSTSLGEWVVVTKHKNGNVDYIDPDKIKIDGSSRYFWVLEDYKIPDKDGIMSLMIYTHAECYLQQTQNLKYATYELSMGKGSAKDIWTAWDQRWVAAKPGSVRASNLKFVCSYPK